MKQPIKNLRLLIDNAVKADLLKASRALSMINNIDEIEAIGADLLGACELVMELHTTKNTYKTYASAVKEILRPTITKAKQ